MGNGRFYGVDASGNDTRWYYCLAVFAQIPGIAAIVLTFILFGVYRGGFGWGSNLAALFNYHPLFMGLGMIFLYGDAILTYRILRNNSRFAVKITHGILLMLSLIFSSIGLAAVFDNHANSKPPLPDLYSLHSWIGLTAVVLFAAQWVCGFLTFLFPKLSERVRETYMPSHKFWGKTIFMFALIAFMMGISEYSIFGNLNAPGTKYQKNMLNMVGVLFLIFGVIVLYLLGDDHFQRPKESKDEHIPLTE